MFSRLHLRPRASIHDHTFCPTQVSIQPLRQRCVGKGSNNHRSAAPSSEAGHSGVVVVVPDIVTRHLGKFGLFSYPRRLCEMHQDGDSPLTMRSAPKMHGSALGAWHKRWIVLDCNGALFGQSRVVQLDRPNVFC